MDPLSAYPEPGGRAVAKEIDRLDRHCRAFIGLSPFAVLSSATAEGEPDVSPRGGLPGFVKVLDEHRLMLPDRLGNNRLDSLRKISANPRVAMLFMVPGIDETLRVYGDTDVTDAASAPVAAEERGRPPRSVLVLRVRKAFFHCAKALMRAELWNPDAQVPRDALPSTGQILRDHAGGSGPVETEQAMRERYLPQL